MIKTLNRAYAWRNNPVFWAFAACFVYWGYLYLTSRMAVIYDSLDYEYLGRMISQKGWFEYFKTGPQREPLYPALIAISMGLGRALGVSYQAVQVLLQLAILFLAQILTLRILRILKVRGWLCAFAVLYLGISPAMLNSALSLFSEVAIYPLVLYGVLLVYRAAVSFDGSKARIILLAAAAGLTFALMVLAKGIFEPVTPVFFVLFISLLLLGRKRRSASNCFVYLAVACAVFYSLVVSYKLANMAFNGQFTVTNRGALSLYGCTARRMEPLTRERFLTALAYVPGKGLCDSVFGDDLCGFWAFGKTDEMGSQKAVELSGEGITQKEMNGRLIFAAVEKARSNIPQYLLLFLVEGSKAFFWESTQVGFVEYPGWLQRIFNWRPVKDGLRLLMSLLTVAACVYLAVFLWRERRRRLIAEGAPLMLGLCFLFIFSFTACYAVFTIIVRYLLPVVPLYLIIIAYASERVLLFIGRDG